MSAVSFRLSPESSIQDYLSANQEWATSASPAVLNSNSLGQQPHTLWIGCADSRCSEFALKNLQPGEIFTHRNIANIMNNPSDPSSKAILKFAVESLKVKKILVTGHTKCGGVDASLSIANSENYYDSQVPSELVDWLSPLISLKFKHQHELQQIEDPVLKNKKLGELNVKAQIESIKQNPVVNKAMEERGLEVYGLVYDVDTGLLKLA
ncbi:carbonate dehydratase [Saccharomycopsis crataegensis]|uniref:Carbonic anhydrase n=1 Tax=Saccharomycopsis crataegensis TaxID=43959 RepID=A0AAV5QIS6_9ASCO|nr:carbonate dehydratase [Saccharomycopsis crataegensis]